MRITDYGKGITKKRTGKIILKLHGLFCLDLELCDLVTTFGQLRRMKKDLKCMLQRKRAVKMTYFNVNILSTSDALRMFRFRHKELHKVSDVINFSGKIKRRR